MENRRVPCIYSIFITKHTYCQTSSRSVRESYEDILPIHLSSDMSDVESSSLHHTGSFEVLQFQPMGRGPRQQEYLTNIHQAIGPNLAIGKRQMAALGQ